MKRLITLFACMIMGICLVTSCSVPLKNSVSRKNGLNSAFESNVSVTLDKLQAEGTLHRFGDAMWDIEFTAPNTLSGVKLSFSEGNVDASYKGLSFSVPQSALPVKAMMLNLIEAVDDNARLAELKGEEKDDTLEISGKLEGGEYIITVDKDGRLLSFEMPNNKLKMLFGELKITEETPSATVSASVTSAAPSSSSAVSSTATTSAQSTSAVTTTAK